MDGKVAHAHLHPYNGQPEHSRHDEKKVGDHHNAGDRGNGCNVAAEVRHEHEKCDAGAGAEQHSCADHVEKFQGKIEHQRSSRIASATMVSASTTPIFSMGPSG